VNTERQTVNRLGRALHQGADLVLDGDGRAHEAVVAREA
jgi:hypothetical protein